MNNAYDLLKNMAREKKEHGFDILTGMAFGLSSDMFGLLLDMPPGVLSFWRAGTLEGLGVHINIGEEAVGIPPIPVFLLPAAPPDAFYMGKFEHIYELSRRGGDK